MNLKGKTKYKQEQGVTENELKTSDTNGSKRKKTKPWTKHIEAIFTGMYNCEPILNGKCVCGKVSPVGSR